MEFVGSFFAFLFMGFLLHAHSLQFKVGGREGWTTSPSEKYDHWSSRNRFQVNDTLLFEYVKGTDSVLLVKKEDYDACNNCHPLQKLEDGRSLFKFGNSGPFFFISGNQSRCMEGEKLLVVVLAVRHPKPPSSPPVVVAPTASPSPAPAGGAVPKEVPPPAEAGVKVPPPTASLSPSPALGAPSPGPSEKTNGGFIQSVPGVWVTLAGAFAVMAANSALQSILV